MTKLGSVLVRDYLKRLDRISRDIPRVRRSELREEIEQHLADSIPPDATEAEVRLALERLGTPERIVAVEREQLGIVLAAATWEGFIVWAVLGVVGAFTLLVFGTLGLVPVLLGGWVAATRPGFRRSGFGALTGVGAMLLYIAYVQRRGPGTVCWHTATASGCDQHADPWPFLIVGVALIAVGFVAHTRRMRLGSHSDS